MFLSLAFTYATNIDREGGSLCSPLSGLDCFRPTRSIRWKEKNARHLLHLPFVAAATLDVKVKSCTARAQQSILFFPSLFIFCGGEVLSSPAAAATGLVPLRDRRDTVVRRARLRQHLSLSQRPRSLFPASNNGAPHLASLVLLLSGK